MTGLDFFHRGDLYLCYLLLIDFESKNPSVNTLWRQN